MKRIRFFISSVQSEFAEERAMLSQYVRTDALLGKFFETFLFEDVPANEASPQQVYLSEVEMSDIYLGLYGNKVGTGTMDIVTLCKGKGLKKPEYHQEEDFRVVIWRKKPGGDPEAVQNDPEAVQNDPEVIRNDSALVDKVYEQICANHSISRGALARTLNTSERQVRKAIDALRDKKIRRKSGDSGEWEIIG